MSGRHSSTIVLQALPARTADCHPYGVNDAGDRLSPLLMSIIVYQQPKTETDNLLYFPAENPIIFPFYNNYQKFTKN